MTAGIRPPLAATWNRDFDHYNISQTHGVSLPLRIASLSQ